MKRITYNVALDSVISVVSGFQKIKIYDRENEYDKEPKLLFNGLTKDFGSIHTKLPYGYSEYKVSRSMVWRIDVEEEYLVFTLQTKYEQY